MKLINYYYYYTIKLKIQHFLCLIFGYNPQKYWENRAKNHQIEYKFHKYFLFKEEHTKELIDILKNLKPDSLLEVGCGYGRILKLLKHLKIKLVGVDISKNEIINAKNYLNDNSIQLEVIDGTTLPFKNNDFDAVLTYDTLHFVPENQFRLLKKEICRVTREYLIIGAVIKKNIISKHVFSYNYKKEFEELGLKTILDKKLTLGFHLFIFKKRKLVKF